MVVNYFGDGCFRAQSGETSLLVDPTNNRLKSTVTLRTLIPGNAVPSRDEIAFPGEYEIGGLVIRGWLVPRESTDKYLKTIYEVAWDDVRLVFLGRISKMLEAEEVIGEISEPDVLFLPVGEHFLSAADAAKLVKKLEPAVVIPGSRGSPAEFLRAAGQKGEAEEKFVFKKKDLANSKGRIMVLKSQA